MLQMAKTYNSGDSLVVTDPTTNPPVSGLTMGERTGSRIFHYLWSYVLIVVQSPTIFYCKWTANVRPDLQLFERQSSRQISIDQLEIQLQKECLVVNIPSSRSSPAFQFMYPINSPTIPISKAHPFEVFKGQLSRRIKGASTEKPTGLIPTTTMSS